MKLPATVDITFFVPCFNEAEHIASTLFMINTLMKDRPLNYEIFVVDDGSSDNTSQIVEEYRQRHPQEPVLLQRNSANLRLGRNYVLCAQKAHGRYYLLINGDNDTGRNDFAAILEHLGKADMIVPYVTNQNERPLHRNLISRLFTLLVSLVSGHRLKYYNGPVLHLRENVIRYAPQASGFTYQAEILCQALSAGCTYLEVPLHYVKNHRSRSSAFRPMNMASVIKSLFRIFVTSAKRRLGRRKTAVA